MLKLKNVSKFYNTNGVVSLGLKNISLDLKKNEIVAICGESGSGKSTLLNVLTKMDTFDEGEIYFKGEETSYFDIDDMDKFRKNKVGFIFQNYNIIESYTVLNNVMLPFIINGYSKKEAKEKALDLINKVGLSHRIKNKGSKLSGGEKQRCVIARALAYDCEILACDEPTGNLDSETGAEIIKLIKDIAPNKLVLIVSHNFDEIKNIVTRKITLRDGEILSDEVYKEVEEVNEVYEEPDNGQVNTKNVLRIASNNIINTPKKTIFISIVYAIMSFIVLISFLLTNMSITQLKNQDRNYFYNLAENTVYVGHNENLTKDDFSDYKNVVYNPYESLATNRFYTKRSHNFQTISAYDNTLYATYQDGLCNDVTFGRLAQNDGEINIALPCTASDSDAKDLLNEIITIDRNNGYSECKITGVKILPLSNRTSSNVLFGNKKFAREIRISMIDDISVSNSSNYEYDFLDRIVLSNDEKTTIYLSTHYYNYGVKDVTYTIYGYSKSKSFREKFTLKNYEVKESDSNISYIVIGNDFEEDEIKCALISDINVSKTLEDLGNRGIFAVDQKNYICSSNILYIGSYIGFIVTIVFSVLCLYFITYFILRIIYKSKINDFNIMRTLGVTVKSMRKIVEFELLVYSSVISVLLLLINYICYKNVRNAFFQIFDNLNVIVIILYFASVLALSLLIARRFNRKLFKFSVNSSFERRGK